MGGGGGGGCTQCVGVAWGFGGGRWCTVRHLAHSGGSGADEAHGEGGGLVHEAHRGRRGTQGGGGARRLEWFAPHVTRRANPSKYSVQGNTCTDKQSDAELTVPPAVQAVFGNLLKGLCRNSKKKKKKKKERTQTRSTVECLHQKTDRMHLCTYEMTLCHYQISGRKTLHKQKHDSEQATSSH